jgi:hypothetical protein
VRSKLAGFCREPLVHFLAIGAGFFLLWHCVGAQPQRILITPARVERLAQQWTKTHLRPPSAEELAGLVEQEIDEEFLYWEAVAMGLDRDDLVIRRRLAVRMEFLTDDLARAANPSDEQLQAFLRRHPDKLNVEPLTTFAQVYIDRSKRGAGAAAEVERLLALLRDRVSSDWQTLGDPLPLPTEYEAAATADVVRLFGHDFPAKLSGLPVGRWSGPVESTYGLHLILVRARTAGRINVGVEIGQLAFVCLVLLLERSFRQLEIRWPVWVAHAPGYLVGSLGALWTIQRAVVMVGWSR